MLRDVQEWTGHRQDAFGSPTAVWNDGADFEALRARWLAEPDYVEAVLAHGLIARDPLAAEALTHLPLNDEASERFTRLLTGCLDTQTIGFRLAAVGALYALTSDESWAGEVVRVLLGAGFWGDRMEAARVLGGFSPTRHLIRAVAQAVEDPDCLVRRQAATTLLGFGGRAPDASPTLFAAIRSETGCQQWAVAARELADLASVHAEAR